MTTKLEQESGALTNDRLRRCSPKLPLRKCAIQKTGDRVGSKITSVGKQRVMVDLGEGIDALMDLVEFESAEHAPVVGDVVEGYVLSVENRIAQIGRSVQKGQQGMHALEQAKEARVPVEGTISAVNKGGYVVEISGVRCFCPWPTGWATGGRSSQAHRQQVHLLGDRDQAKDVVLSRRALLDIESKSKRIATMAKLEVGAVLEGTVVNVREFGALVDIGGIEGLVPVSEMSFGRVKAADVVKIGDVVRVSVQKLEGNKDGVPERISLSMRALLDDPLEAALLDLQEGMIIQGIVSSLMLIRRVRHAAERR